MSKTFTVYSVEYWYYDENESGDVSAYGSLAEATKAFNAQVAELKTENVDAKVVLYKTEVLKGTAKWAALRMVDQKGFRVSQTEVKAVDIEHKAATED